MTSRFAIPRAVLLAVGCAVLGGCSLFSSTGPLRGQQPQNLERYEQRRSDLLAIRQWSLQARVATGRLIGWTGNLRWKQNDEAFDLVISGPLGGGMRAKGVPQRVVVTTSQGSFETSDPEAVFEQELGWRFPLSRLRYWSVGLPDPRLGFTGRRIDDAGLLRQVVQEGWTVTYEAYMQVQARVVPASMTLSDGDKTLRVVIDKWLRLG